MTKIQISKRLVVLTLVLGAASFVAGCHSTGSNASMYSDSGTGGTGSSGYTESSSSAQSSATSSEAAQGQVVVPLYEEQLIVGTRTTESEGARLRKDVTTETVSQPVQIRRETLVINREAAPATASGQANTQSGSLSTPFEKGELVIRLHNEEPVVEKRIVPSGRIVVQTRSSTEQMNVQREVRKEKINVDKMGDGQNVTISENVGGQSNEATGAAPAEHQEIQGKQSSESGRAPVTTRENEPFPRPQPDGKETFPNLDKNPEPK
jgi:uncharacterized protein (TIGR02271 family)